MKVTVRPLVLQDVPKCAAIVWDNWNPTVGMRFHDEAMSALHPGGPLYYVAECNGTIVGFAGMMPSRLMYGVWDFIWVNVHQDYRGRGVGRQLTEFRIREVLKRDGRAIHLMTLHPSYFAEFGFSVSKDYGDWKLMTAHLGPLAL